MTTTSVYPSAIDNFATHGATMDLPETHEDIHLTVEDAIEKIETELGTTPSGSAATVAARLAIGGQLVGLGELIATSTGYNLTVADITNVTTTFTAVSGAYYATIVHLPSLRQQTSTGGVEAHIADGSNTILQRRFFDADAAADFGMTILLIESGLSGSTTRKARLLTSAGTVDVFGASNIRNFIAVVGFGLV